MFHKKILFCPVCDSQLGLLTHQEVCSFVCRECKFIYTWGRDGKLKKPVQLDEKKPLKCECASCKARDEKPKNINEDQ